MPYTLGFADRYRRTMESAIISDTAGSSAFASIPFDMPTLLRVEWTGEMFSKLLSSVMTGADLMWPDEADEIIWQLLKAVHLNPTLPEEGGCFEFFPSAPFISFYPDNPYVSGDKSAGWNKEAWYLWPQFDSFFPDWFDNWLNGLISSLTQYQASDVLFNIESIPINPIDAWLNGGGILPKIEIRFSGTGKINLQLLSFPLGGKAIIELDSEPNALDILTGGILDPEAFMVELNRDVINFPPDEYPLVSIPIEVTETGEHILYVVFIPILDDNLLPIGFGGGFRGIEFCDFTDGGTQSMIENIVWTGCELQKIVGGEPVTIVTAEEIQACMDIPEGGGGGGGAGEAIIGSYRVDTNLTSNSTSYVDIDATNIAQEIILANDSKVSAAFYFPQTRKDSAQTGTYRLVAESTSGGQEIVMPVKSAAEAEGIWLLGTWVLAAGTYTIKPQFKSSNSNVIVVKADNTVSWQILIFTDLEADFVQDIRIEEGELQKMIGGVWYDIEDSFAAIISNLQSQISTASALASSAAAAAAAAQTTANAAAAANIVQNGRLTDLEDTATDHETRITTLETTATDHETRITDLENAPSGGGAEFWEETFSWMSSNPTGWGAIGATRTNGIGLHGEDGYITLQAPIEVNDNRILSIKAKIKGVGGVGSGLVNIQLDGAVSAHLGSIFAVESVVTTGYVNTGNRSNDEINDTLEILFTWDNVDDFDELQIQEITIVGQGVNPFI